MNPEPQRQPSGPEESKSPEPAKRIEWATFAIVLLTGAGMAGKFLIYERPVSRAEARQADEQLVSVNAELFAPTTAIPFDGFSRPVQPMVVTISNIGDVPIETNCVELRLFRGDAASIARFEQTTLPGLPIDQSGRIGVIDLRSSAWVELPEHRQPVQTGKCTIRGGEQRQIPFHISVPPSDSGQMIKLVAIVHPAPGQRWEPQTWEGFADTCFCVARPHYPGINGFEAFDVPAVPVAAEYAAPAPAAPDLPVDGELTPRQMLELRAAVERMKRELQQVQRDKTQLGTSVDQSLGTPN
jgi:hypothetical protein